MTTTLKGLRGNFDLTQEEAAKKIGVSEATWRRYEKAKSFPDVPLIKKIEEEFNVKYDDINFLPLITVKPLIKQPT